MDLQETNMDKKSSLNWFLHKRFITIGLIMGILVFIYDVVIVRMSFAIRDYARAAGDNSKDWLAVTGIIFGVLALVVIVVVDLIRWHCRFSTGLMFR